MNEDDTHLLLAVSWDVSGGAGGTAGQHGRPGNGGQGGRGGEGYSWFVVLHFVTHVFLTSSSGLKWLDTNFIVPKTVLAAKLETLLRVR